MKEKLQTPFLSAFKVILCQGTAGFDPVPSSHTTPAAVITSYTFCVCAPTPFFRPPRFFPADWNTDLIFLWICYLLYRVRAELGVYAASESKGPWERMPFMLIG